LNCDVHRRRGDRGVHAEHTLEKLLHRIADLVSRKGFITIGKVMRALGRRSFAPVLLITACLGFTPIGAVPGMPTALAIIIILVSVQIILGRRHLWLPRFILRKRLGRDKVIRAVEILTTPARVLDSITRPRLTSLTREPFSIFLAAACIVLALTVPPMELVPFVDIPVWMAIVALSFALVSHDGIIAIIAFIITIVSLWILLESLF
jgi:hypothetical protein